MSAVEGLVDTPIVPQEPDAGAREAPVPLGQSGVRVSPLGLGCWAWGDRLTWGYGRDYGEAECRGAFAAGVDGGVTWFDTAEVYGSGESERLLGRFIREAGAGAGADRDGRPDRGDGAGRGDRGGPGDGGRVLVASKFAPLPWRRGPGALLEAVRGSLARLGRLQIDLYQVHFPMPLFSVERRMESLAAAVEAGLVRAVGVSNYGATDLRRAHRALAQRGIPLASNQVHYSLLHRAPERNGVLQACRDLGVSLIAYSPLEGGLLSGKYGPDRPVPFPRSLRFRAGRLASLSRLTDALRATGEAHGGKTPAQVALRWLMERGTLPIPGAKSASQAADNAGALGWRLSAQEVEGLDRLSR